MSTNKLIRNRKKLMSPKLTYTNEERNKKKIENSFTLLLVLLINARKNPLSGYLPNHQKPSKFIEKTRLYYLTLSISIPKANTLINSC